MVSLKPLSKAMQKLSARSGDILFIGAGTGAGTLGLSELFSGSSRDVVIIIVVLATVVYISQQDDLL